MQFLLAASWKLVLFVSQFGILRVVPQVQDEPEFVTEDACWHRVFWFHVCF